MTHIINQIGASFHNAYFYTKEKLQSEIARIRHLSNDHPTVAKIVKETRMIFIYLSSVQFLEVVFPNSVFCMEFGIGTALSLYFFKEFVTPGIQNAAPPIGFDDNPVEGEENVVVGNFPDLNDQPEVDALDNDLVHMDESSNRFGYGGTFFGS